jgi:hypothetical protein
MEINRKQFLSLLGAVEDISEFVAELARRDGVSTEEAARLKEVADRLLTLRLNALGDWSSEISPRLAAGKFELMPTVGNA